MSCHRDFYANTLERELLERTLEGSRIGKRKKPSQNVLILIPWGALEHE